MRDVVIVRDFVNVVGSAVERPEEARDLDLLFRATYRDGDVIFPAETFILAVRDAARELLGRRDLDVHPIFNPTGPHQGTYVPVADLVVRFHADVAPVVVKAALPSGWPPKPAVAFYTEHFSPDELWERWGKTRAPFAVEPKLNGWRTLVVRDGDDVSVYFEDGEDYARLLEPLVRRILALDVRSITLDGDLGVRDRASGRRWPRKDLAALRTGIDWDEAEPVFVAFDVLELNGEDLRAKPFSERRNILMDVAPGLAVSQRIVRDLDELRDAFNQFSRTEQSEGIVAKTLNAPYPSGATNEWSKVKVRLEVKARVVSRRRLKNGMYTYLCEWADGGSTGWTMPTKVEAETGDVLTVAVQEINVTSHGVTWQNGSVVDVDPNGRPYTAEQAVSLARRYLRTFAVREKAMRLPFSQPGSKWRLGKRIARYVLSVPHRVYVEPFAGTGAVLLRIPKREGVTEVLNDLDGRRIRALRFLSRASDEELERALRRVREIPANEETFNRVIHEEPRSDEDCFVVVRYLTTWGRRGADSRKGDFTMHHRRIGTAEDFAEIRERLKDVKFTIEDALECIGRWDSPDTLFYLDPPYPGYDMDYRREYSHEDFVRLLERLKNIKGKFILSCMPENVRGIELPKSWTVKRLYAVHTFAVSSAYDVPRRRYELLIMNFDPEEKSAGRQMMPFRLPGSKWRVAPKLAAIITKVPHSTYVEPFAGTGAVLMRTPKRDGVKEVLNDVDDRKVRALRFLARASDDELREALELARSYGTTDDEFNRITERRPRSDKEAFALLRYLTVYGVRGADAGRGMMRTGRIRSIGSVENFALARERLRDVTFTSEDALECIRRWDSPDTLFYLDPPYPKSIGGYRFSYTMDDFAKLVETLKKIRGKFILSCTSRDLDGIELPESWTKRRIAVRHSFGARWWGETPTRYELLVMNFDPDDFKAAHASVTRSEVSERAWEQHWHEFYPPDGTGRFVAQYHWRGLSGDELEMSADELAARGRSVHLDLRFTTRDGGPLWGITVFDDGSKDPLERLLKGEPVQAAPKQPEPYEWLAVADERPYVAGPGEVGATSSSYARIDRVDGGTYSAGTWNRHSAEVVLNGERLKGRFLFRRISGDGVWTLERADDEPIASRESLEALSRRLAERGHRLLIYRDPYSGDGPRVVRLKGEIRFPRKAAETFRKLMRVFARLLHKPRKAYIITPDRRFVVLVATNAFRDTDGEVVSRRAIARMLESPPRATLRLFHTPGTDFADVVGYVFRPESGMLLAIARVRDDDNSRSIVEFLDKYKYGHPDVAPLGWATSARFVAVRDPDSPDEIRDITIQEISVLPLHEAANPLTFFVETSDGGAEP